MVIQQESILIVDDDEGVLTALEAELHDHYAVTAVTSAEQALARLQMKAYAAIISDVRMPGIDGLSLISQCAVRYPHMVRIILTAFDGEDVHETAVGPHGAFKLVKPWGDDLIITLQNALKQRESNMALRRHLDLKSELLDIDRRLHPQLDADALIREAAILMIRAPEVVAAAVYVFDEFGVASLAAEIMHPDDAMVPELKKTHSSPVPYRGAYLYSVPIGDWNKPFAAVALRLTNDNSDTLRYLDFVGRQAARTMQLLAVQSSSSTPAVDDFEGRQVSSAWLVDELTTPATVMASAPYNMRRLIETLVGCQSNNLNVAPTLDEIDELLGDVEEVAGSLITLLNQLRSQNTSIAQARPNPSEV